MPKFFTVREVVVQHEGYYSRATLHRWLLSGRVKGLRLAGPAGRWLIPEDEVAKLAPQAPEQHTTQEQR